MLDLLGAVFEGIEYLIEAMGLNQIHLREYSFQAGPFFQIIPKEVLQQEHQE